MNGERASQSFSTRTKEMVNGFIQATRDNGLHSQECQTLGCNSCQKKKKKVVSFFHFTVYDNLYQEIEQEPYTIFLPNTQTLPSFHTCNGTTQILNQADFQHLHTSPQNNRRRKNQEKQLQTPCPFGGQVYPNNLLSQLIGTIVIFSKFHMANTQLFCTMYTIQTSLNPPSYKVPTFTPTLDLFPAKRFFFFFGRKYLLKVKLILFFRQNFELHYITH